jgi:hypothetical protein
MRLTGVLLARPKSPGRGVVHPTVDENGAVKGVDEA